MNRSNTTLRKQIRSQRKKLTLAQKNAFAHRASRHLSKLPLKKFDKNVSNNSITKKTKIAVFLDAFGEMPTQPIADWAYRQGFDVYLPVVTHKNRALSFIKVIKPKLFTNRLIHHKLGMKQPVKGKKLLANQLDILFMPLVALDKQGHRLGMGGGFYDKTLAKCRKKPVKIAWAYDFQLVENLTVNAWDIGVDMAVLPSGLLIF